MEAEQNLGLRMFDLLGVGYPMDHILKIDTRALESHKTVMVVTSSDAFMVHDEAAVSVAKVFGLRKAEPVGAPAPAAPVETKRESKRGNKAA